MDSANDQGAQLAPKSLTGGDYAFIFFIILVLIAVAMLGVVDYREALKTEGSKRNGEQWASWFTTASAERFSPEYALAACAGGAKPAAAPAVSADAQSKPSDEAPAVVASTGPAPGTWGACLAQLKSDSEFKDMVNPFTGESPVFIAACNPSDHSLVGSIVIEKITANPPGSAVPTVTSQLLETDAIAEKLQLKISICDKGSYAVKVAELEF